MSDIKTYYLHAEAINFMATILDTQDLSTMRGSSLAALNAIIDINKKFDLKEISLGASTGLWEIKCDETKIKNEISSYLKGHEIYQHLTFAVETCEEQKTFIKTKEQLIKQVRLSQLQTTLKPLFYVPLEDAKFKVCELDFVSPANKTASIKGNSKTCVSLSVYNRRDYGRDAKQEFYENYLSEYAYNHIADKTKLPFALHFDSICEEKGVREQLKGKMAVFYADGNSFNKKINAYAKNPTLYTEIDSKMRGNRKAFLTKALDFLVKNNAIGEPSKDEIEERKHLGAVTSNIIRFETLLWGGDEFMFVMPARLGFEFAKMFYDCASQWTINDELLTFASGLVFCHHNAPISRIAALAKSLADHAKGRSRDEGLVNALVLESFDHVGSDFDSFWEKRISEVLKNKPFFADNLIMNCERLEYLITASKELEDKKEWFSRRQLKSGAFALHRGSHNGRDFKAVLEHLSVFSHKESDHIFDETPEKISLWLQLDEFWDYLLPIKKEGDDA